MERLDDALTGRGHTGAMFFILIREELQEHSSGEVYQAHGVCACFYLNG